MTSLGPGPRGRYDNESSRVDIEDHDFEVRDHERRVRDDVEDNEDEDRSWSVSRTSQCWSERFRGICPNPPWWGIRIIGKVLSNGVIWKGGFNRL